MRIGLFSDVRADLNALNSLFKDLERRNLDAVYCLGDVAGELGWPNEVIAQIRKRGIPVIGGDLDYWVGQRLDEQLAPLAADEDPKQLRQAIDYTNWVIGDDERRYLRTLPRVHKLEYQLGEESIRLLLLHELPGQQDSSPEGCSDKELWRLIDKAGADIVCIGHGCTARHRIVQKQGQHRHLVQVGSVGREGEPGAPRCYTVLTITDYSTMRISNSVHVEFIRIPAEPERPKIVSVDKGLNGTNRGASWQAR